MQLSEAIQSLEKRQLFAIPVSGGTATINGTSGADVLEIVVNAGVLQVRNAAGAVVNSVSASGVTKIAVNGGGGNDFVRLGRANGTLVPNVPSTIAGNAGNDTLIGGNKADQIFGGANNDRIDGRGDKDLLDGGDGFDTLDYSYRTVPVKVTLANSGTGNDGSNSGNNSSISVLNDNGGDNSVNNEAVVGGTGADNITGSAAANWIDSGGGNDTIFGGAGIDTIVGGVHSDLAYGEGDDDTFLMKDATADQFLGTPGTTFAQYDTGVDSPAPSVAAAASLSLAQTFSQSLALASASGDLILDETFGLNEDGKQVVSSGAGSLDISDVTIQSVETSPGVFEDKIIAVGAVYYASEAPSDFVVMRFNADGSQDTTFGPNGNGIVFTDFSFVDIDSSTIETSDSARSVTIDSQGRIVVAGSAQYLKWFYDESTAYLSQFAIARYMPDGTIDPFFGFDGVARIDPNGFYSYDSGARIVSQQVFDGETFVDTYLVAGTVGPDRSPDYYSPDGNESFDFGLIRLDDAGNMDEDFGPDGLFGLVQEDFGVDGDSTDDYLSGLAVDDETGNIWLSGESERSDSPTEFAVVGYDSEGELLFFGKQTYAFESNAYAADAMIAERQLIVVGSLGSDGYYAGAILATSIEAPIPSFTFALAAGESVTAVFNDPDATYETFSSVTLDADGNGVVVGESGGDFSILRFNVGDLSVVGSAQRIDLYDSSDVASAVAVQPDGKYVIVGQYDSSSVGLMRLQQETGETWVDVDLDFGDVQTPGFFTYVDENGNTQPVPTYLVWRYTRLDEDGTWTIEGTDIGEYFEIILKNGIVTVTRDGEFWQEPASLVTKIVINALGGNDSVRVAGNVKIPVRVNAGEGNDDIRGSTVADELYGDGGNDLLVGLGGNDTILGGSGRDVLFGGYDFDDLNGESGEDVLVAGKARWEDDHSQLQKIYNEWVRTDLSYAKRVNNLIKGGGKNGSVKLDASTTSSSRSVVDILTGGSDTDAFWGNFRKPGDLLKDRKSNEVVTSTP